MSTHRIAVSAALLALVMAGCAHKAPAPPSAATRADAASVPAANPTTPDGIVALGKRLATYRRAIYSVTQDKYSYFAGSELSAEYDVSSGVVKMASLEAGKTNLICEYTPQGVLFVDPARSDKEAFVAGCDQLALRLNEHLSR